MKRLLALVLIALVLIPLLTACPNNTEPQKGQPCQNQGDVYSHSGKILVCGHKSGERQLTWH